MMTRKKQTPKTWRRVDDLACGEFTGAITCDLRIEAKHLGKDLVVEDKIVDARAAIFQVPGITALATTHVPNSFLGAYMSSPHGARQVCNHINSRAKSRYGHFFSDAELFALTAASTSLRTPSGSRSFAPISRLSTKSDGAV